MTEKKGMKQIWMVEDLPATATREAKSFWTKVGVAFENRDGSFNLHLSAIPVSGKLQMREFEKRESVAA